MWIPETSIVGIRISIRADADHCSRKSKYELQKSEVWAVGTRTADYECNYLGFHRIQHNVSRVGSLLNPIYSGRAFFSASKRDGI